MMNNTTGNGTWTLNLNATRPMACYFIPCLFTNTELVVIAICSFSVILAGIVGNVCTGIVFIASKNSRSISNFSTISLTVADLLLSMVVAPIAIISVFFVKGWVFGAVMCKLNTFIQRVAVSAILLNLLVVSLERFLVVCFPFFMRTRKKLFLYAILLVWIVAIAISIPDVFYMQLLRTNYGEFCFNEPSAQAKLFKSFNDVFFFAVVAIMLPIQMITICFLRIKGAALKHKSKANYIRRRNACYMLFMLMISCIVCWFPVKISAMIFARNSKAGEKRDFKTINIVLVVTFLLYFSCTVIHPIIFFFLSPKGKQTVNIILRKGKKQKMGESSQKSKETFKTASKRRTLFQSESTVVKETPC